MPTRPHQALPDPLDHSDLAQALRARHRAIYAKTQAEARTAVAEARAAFLESVLVEVWRWTHDGHPHLELLIPVLRKGDADYKAIAELEEIATSSGGG